MRETFVVEIRDGQNGSWQGTINWAEGHMTQAFRSELELIRLIDSALAGQKTEKEASRKNPSHPPEEG